MTTPNERRQALTAILEQRVLVLDGAMGTMLQQRNLTAADFCGPVLEGCNESLNRTRSDVVLDIHRAYLATGSDAIETNTFNCDRISLHDYGLQDDVRELNVTAAKLARQATDEFWTAEKPRFVIGSMGPTKRALRRVDKFSRPNHRPVRRSQPERCLRDNGKLEESFRRVLPISTFECECAPVRPKG